MEVSKSYGCRDDDDDDDVHVHVHDVHEVLHEFLLHDILFQGVQVRDVRGVLHDARGDVEENAGGCGLLHLVSHANRYGLFFLITMLRRAVSHRRWAVRRRRCVVLKRRVVSDGSGGSLITIVAAWLLWLLWFFNIFKPS